MGGIIGGKHFLNTFNNPSATLIGTIVAIVRIELLPITWSKSLNVGSNLHSMKLVVALERS